MKKQSPKNDTEKVIGLAKEAFLELLKTKGSLFNRNSDHKTAKEAQSLKPEERLTKRQVNKRLYDAAEAGDTNDIDKWVAKGAELEFKGIGELTPLGAAISKGQTLAVEHLLKIGASPAARLDGNTRHIIGVMRHNFEGDAIEPARPIVDLIFNHPKNVFERKDPSDFESWGNSVILCKAKAAGVAISEESFLLSAIREACHHGSNERAAEAIANVSDPVKTLAKTTAASRASGKNSYSANPVIYDAIRGDNVKALIFLMENRLAEPLADNKWRVFREDLKGTYQERDAAEYGKEGMPYLAHAAIFGASRVCHTIGRVKSLAKDLDDLTTTQLGALYSSRNFGSETVAALIESGLDLCRQDNKGDTFLHVALSRMIGRGIVETIIRKFPGIENIRNNLGDTPLQTLAKATSNYRRPNASKDVDELESFIANVRLKKEIPKKGLSVKSKKKPSSSI